MLFTVGLGSSADSLGLDAKRLGVQLSVTLNVDDGHLVVGGSAADVRVGRGALQWKHVNFGLLLERTVCWWWKVVSCLRR